jgi:hypothetical protein
MTAPCDLALGCVSNSTAASPDSLVAAPVVASLFFQQASTMRHVCMTLGRITTTNSRSRPRHIFKHTQSSMASILCMAAGASRVRSARQSGMPLYIHELLASSTSLFLPHHTIRVANSHQESLDFP